MTGTIDPAAVAALAPSGTLRAAINFGNPVLAQKDPASGEPRGVSAALARALAKRLGVPIAFVTYDGAGKVFEAATANVWDIAFLAIDPVRAAEIDFTGPYVIIEGAYAVPSGSPLRAIGEVDRPGVRIAVAKGAAYDLYLSRAVQHATLVRAGSPEESAAMFLRDTLDVLAGVKQPLQAFARANPGVRVLDGRFMAIEQAMGTVRGRAPGAAFLRRFVEEMKASGFVAQALKESGQGDATVAPAA